jgi:hypothetical protein
MERQYPDEGWTELAVLPSSQTDYLDTTPAAGAYSYVISALDTSGNESLENDTVTVTTTTGTPPTDEYVYVSAIDVWTVYASRKYTLEATVQIERSDGTASAGSTVIANVYFKDRLAEAGLVATADSDGIAQFTSGLYPGKPGDTFILEIVDVIDSSSAYPFDPANSALSASIAIQ